MPVDSPQAAVVLEDELLKHKLNLLSCVSALEEHARTLKRAEESLRENEETIRGLLEHASHAILTVDGSGSIVQVNAMAVRLFGYSREEFASAPIELLLPETEQYFKNAGPGSNGPGIECAGRRKDGSPFYVEISFSQVSTKIGIQVTAFLSDITERKRDEATLRDSEETTRALLESASHAIVVADQAGQIVIANAMAEKLFGYERDELFQLPIDKLMPEGVRERDALDRTDPSCEPRTGPLAVGLELTARSKAGTEIPVEVSLSYMKTKRGLFVVSFIMDITERKRARDLLTQQAQDLTRSNADLQQFAYVASHDLQEPLRMISSYAQLLGDKFSSQLNSSGQQYISYMVEGVRRLQALLEDTMSFSRLAHMESLPPSKVALDLTMDSAIKNLRAAIQEAGATVVFETLPVVEGNEVQLIKLFQNLIANAVKYRSADRPPHVCIEATHQNKEWVVAVRDNGAGIESEYHDRIFGLFKRLSRDTPGTGIGLAICKKIVEKHHGRIWLESEAGVGSTFYVALPAAGNLESQEIQTECVSS